MGIILSVLLSLSIAFLLFGSFIPLVLVKIVVMSLGYTVILFARDPFKLYIQDVIFEHTDKSQHQTLLTTMEFGVKIVGAGVGLCFSAVLLGYPLVTVMWIMFAITVIELILNIGICRSVISARKAKICQAD